MVMPVLVKELLEVGQEETRILVVISYWCKYITKNDNELNLKNFFMFYSFRMVKKRQRR